LIKKSGGKGTPSLVVELSIYPYLIVVNSVIAYNIVSDRYTATISYSLPSCLRHA
ncbi:hypothetical protein APHCR_0002, partial [Anaplasma phagocytophilum str. CR1007]